MERRHFQWPWTTPTPSFKVTPFFDAEYLINGTTYRHSFNEILMWTSTRPTQQCHFEWPWVLLSDLAKYSTTRSVSRSLCDSWASCFVIKLCLLYFHFYPNFSTMLMVNKDVHINCAFTFCRQARVTWICIRVSWIFMHALTRPIATIL